MLFVCNLKKENQDASSDLMIGELLDGIYLRHISIVPPLLEFGLLFKIARGSLKLFKKRLDSIFSGFKSVLDFCLGRFLSNCGKCNHWLTALLASCLYLLYKRVLPPHKGLELFDWACSTYIHAEVGRQLDVKVGKGLMIRTL